MVTTEEDQDQDSSGAGVVGATAEVAADSVEVEGASADTVATAAGGRATVEAEITTVVSLA